MKSSRINPWGIIFLIIIGFWFYQLFGFGQSRNMVSYNTFLQLVESGKLQSATITENNVELKFKQPERVKLSDGKEITTSAVSTILLPPQAADPTLNSKLIANGVEIFSRNPSILMSVFLQLLPPFAMFILLFYLISRAQGGGSGVQAYQFGQSRAKIFGKDNKVTTTFNDVAGHTEVKRELIEVVDFLKNPEKYAQIGAEIPKGVLLVGPPGTGKTLLARAVAGEAHVPFHTISASEFMEMFVGVGASRVRSLFDDARRTSPSIIFIDELDSIGRKRGAGIGGGHDEREQTLNQILSEMDGFDKNATVIVLAATNRPDILDKALLRPGRFDRQVVVGLPSLKEREEILLVHMRNKPIDPDVNVNDLAKMTPGMSGADLKNFVNEAALEAARRGHATVKAEDFAQAVDKIMLGLERGSLVLTDEIKRTIAYHEAGHAVVAEVIPEASKVSKVTVVPRGLSLGVTLTPPEEQKTILLTQEQAEAELCVLFGGRVAEELFIGSISSGAANDFQRTITIAKRMVLEWGMGERFKNIAWSGSAGQVFLGEQIVARKDFSEDTAKLVDEDVKGILEKAYQRTVAILQEYAQAMHEVASELLKTELLPGEFVRQAVKKVQTKTISA